MKSQLPRRRPSTSRSAFVESLEKRQLLAGDFNAGVALPYQLDFNRPKGGLVDRDGTGTGFTWAQPNGAGTEFDTSKLNLKIGVGILRLYSEGTAWRESNTLVNALTTRFSASSRAWVVGARINGTLPQIDETGEEGGIIIGPDQDNYIKLVVTAAGNGNVGIQFQDEQRFKVGYRHQLSGQIINIGKGADVQTLDLWFSGDPDTGILRALYRVNTGPIVELAEQILPRKREVFFADSGFAGVFASHVTGGIDFTLDQFGMKRGVLVGEPTNGEGNLTIGAKKLFNDVRGGDGQTVGTSVRNTGTGPITITGLSITGTDAGQFDVTSATLPVTVQPGQSLPIQLEFTAPSATALGVKTATLTIQAEGKTKTVNLRGLATNGTGGENEPSLARLLELYEIPVNVGDPDAATVFLDPVTTPNDEVVRQRFVKAGAGPVVVQPIGVFGVSSNPALRLGWYGAGSPNDKSELFNVATGDAQNVNPVPNGSTEFDPGAQSFGFYSVWPGFANSDSTVRTVYQEDVFNTFDANLKRHIRFYPMRNPDGSAVPNAYVMAHEEFPGGYDFQDVVAIVYNVKDATAGAEIGLENLDGYPASDRLVFNRFRTGDPAHPDTAFHNQAKVRVRNTGNAALDIGSITTTGTFAVVAGGGAQSIAAGGFADVTVRFNGDNASSGVRTGTLTINSNDADEPAKVVTLAGMNQLAPEGMNEAPLAQQMNTIFGYTTSFQNAGQALTNGGKVEAVGDEVLSPYWFRANTLLPVTVKQIASFHTQGDIATLSRHNKGSNTVTAIAAAAGTDAQTFFPRRNGDLTKYAEGSFVPGSTAFGFRVDGNEWSDPTKNQQEQAGGGFGHHLRFFRLRDTKGQFVPDTFLLVMDYAGINYDYNDNTYIISNIRPESGAAAVQVVTGKAATTAQFSAARIATADLGQVETADELLGKSESPVI